MGRGLPVGLQIELDKQLVRAFPLIDMDLQSGHLRIAGLTYNVTYNSQTWYSTHGLGSMEEIVESESDAARCTFTLSGVPTAMIALVLTENVRGRPVTILNAVIDDNYDLIVDENVWQGDLDVMQIVRGKGTGVVSVTAVDRLASWRRPKPVEMSHARQQLVDPTDTFFSRCADLVDKTVVWPSKEFLKQ